MDRDTLVYNIRALMKERGWSGRQLCDKAGLNESAVKNIFNAKSKFPRVDTLFKIARALGMTVGDLIGESFTQLHPNCARLLENFHQLNQEDRVRLVEIAVAWAGRTDDVDLPIDLPQHTPREQRTAILRRVK